MVEALRRHSPHAPPKQTAATILYQAGFTATDIVEEIDDVLGRLSDVTPG